MNNPEINSIAAVEPAIIPEMPRMEVVYKPISWFKEYGRNPRKNDAAVERMCASIREFGFAVAMLCLSTGEIVDGHLRFKGARKLGMQELPVVLCDHWTEGQVKAFRLMVNRSVAWAEWDMDLLGPELLDLKTLNFNLNLTGFDSKEVTALLDGQSAQQGLTDEDAVPELPKVPVSARGDLWVLGSHKVLVGDATNFTEVARLVAGETADIIFTDPPYNVSYEGYTEDRLTIQGDRMTDEQFRQFLEASFRSCRSAVKSGASLYVCHSSSWQREFQNALEAAGFEVRCQIIWAKNTFAWGFGRYKFQHEPLFYCHLAGQKDPWYGDKSQSTLWGEKKPAANRLHPTMKPVELIERALLNSSKAGDIVADLFGGSGSTLIACERRNRSARLMKTARAEVLHDVIVKGQISRDEPLDIGITTAGAEYESPMWWREYQHAKRVLDRSIQSDSFYAAIWEADTKRIESDPEYWKSREARLAANPSHEDLGGFLKDSAIAGELEKALAEPSQRSKYLRYHLNVPLKALEDPVIDMSKWQTCGGGVDFRESRSYDIELLVQNWDLANKPCWAGVDASWTTDLTAVVFVFPPFDGGETWTLLPFFFMPKERVPELERVCRVPYSTWIAQGFIEATAGNAIDLRAVTRRIHWGRDQFELREVPFDRCNFRAQAMELNDEGIQAVEITQGYLHLSHATKFLLSAYVDAKLRHGNNPVLNWMASCLQLQYDHKDNCQPTKPERGKSAKRIDGIAATVNALARAIVPAPNRTSVYETRGVLLI